MRGSEVAYRALLGRIYAENLVGDVGELAVVYDKTPSCVAMAAAVGASSRARVEFYASDEFDVDVDNALLLMSPHLEGLGRRAVAVLRRVRKFAALHTPIFYYLDGVGGVEEVLAGKEARFAVRETPGEITFYRVYVEGGSLRAVAYGVRRLTAEELKIVRRYEAEKE